MATRLSEREAGFRRVLSAYKSRAKRKGLEWQLSDWEVRLLLTSSCFYCGRTSLRTMNRSGRTEDTDYPDLFSCNGIDRVNSALGYLTQNCRPSCQACNIAKNDRDEQAFYIWVQDLYLNLKSKGLICD